MSSYDRTPDLYHSLKIGWFDPTKEFSEVRKDFPKLDVFKEGKIDCSGYRSDCCIQYELDFLEDLICHMDYLDLPRWDLDSVKSVMQRLRNPESMKDVAEFMSLMGQLEYFFVNLEDEILQQVRRMTCEESIRMGEAVMCSRNYCYYASVIMAASAVESRVHGLAKLKDGNYYKERLEKESLGRVLQRIVEDPTVPEEIRAIIPDKHRRLLSLLNHYRVLSAHPKNEYITFQVAQAVINLSFSFLLDPQLAIGNQDNEVPPSNPGEKQTE